MSAAGAKKVRGNPVSSTLSRRSNERRQGSEVRMSAEGAKKARGKPMSSTLRLDE
jgi:hypothetical protein